MRTGRLGSIGTSWGLLALLLGACGGTPMMRVQSPRPTNEPPKLERVVDMGGLDLPASGELSEEESDEVVTPGEWIALLGSGLGSPGGVVRIGTREVPIQGFTDQGGLLVRVPRGLGPVADVSVKTSLGETRLRLAVESYVAVADVGANTLRFFPAQGARLGDEFDTIELKGLRGAVLSNDGALLYAISYKKDERGGYRLLAVHMG